jgi:hypothetical protein
VAGALACAVVTAVLLFSPSGLLAANARVRHPGAGNGQYHRLPPGKTGRPSPVRSRPVAPRPTSTRPPAASPAPTTTPVPPPSSGSTATAPGGVWRPVAGTSWQWQIDGAAIDTSVDAAVFDVDGEQTPAATVAALHAAGRKVICYINAGSWEDWRSDKAKYPATLLGRNYDGWPGERWLDIRRLDVLGPILGARLDDCRAKGFDGVEFDNMESYDGQTGFPITADDQRRFNKWLSVEAHNRGLAAGLKNSDRMATEMQPYFEFVITEDCYAQTWCGAMKPFLAANKPVFAAEYTESGTVLSKYCSAANADKVSVILKHLALDAWRQTC